MNYIEEITKHLRENLGTEWASRVYRSANINVVDDAYSANNVEYKFSAFVLPLDTTRGITDDGTPAVVKRFGIYVFVPNANSQEGSESYDEFVKAEEKMTILLSSFMPTSAIGEIEITSTREYRYGRGYIIYEILYEFPIFDEAAFTGSQTVSIMTLFNDTISAGYWTKKILLNCYVDKQFGISRDTIGNVKNNSITVRAAITDSGDMPFDAQQETSHSFCCMGGDPDVIDKESAIARGWTAFEINSWRYFYNSKGEVIGVEFTGN